MPRKRVFYGYVIVAALFFVAMIMWGTYGSFGIFLKPVVADLGWTRAVTSGAYSLLFFMFGCLGILAGRLTDRLGPKAVLVTGGLFLGGGYMLLGRVTAVWQFYLFYGLFVALGMSGADTAVLTTVARWFVRRRGTATGITKAGAGLGMFVVPFFASWIISKYDWRAAFTVVGAVSLVIGVSAAMFLKRDPTRMGQFPDGATGPVEEKVRVNGHQYSFSEAARTRQFWTVSAVWLLALFSVQVVLAHSAAHVTDVGLSAAVAAAVVSTYGGASVLGRLGFGFISDRLGNKRSFIIVVGLLTAAMAWLIFARSPWMFYLFSLVYGIAHGGLFVVLTPLLAELFGLGAIGGILGVVLFFGTVGGAAGTFLGGRIFDVYGSYHPVFFICLGFSLAAMALIIGLRPMAATAPGKYTVGIEKP